jgi:hypothetical protein
MSTGIGADRRRGDVAGLFDGFEGYRILTDADVDRALTSALVAVDANVLLNLYRYNVQTTNDLLAVFERLGDRLVVPHQAVREFHRNRLAAIGNPDGAAQEVRSALQKNHRSTIDALSRWARQIAPDDTDLDTLQAQLTKVFDGLLEAVSEAEPDRIQADTPAAKDRVLKRLADLLEGKVLVRPPDDEWTKLIAEANAESKSSSLLGTSMRTRAMSTRKGRRATFSSTGRPARKRNDANWTW